MNRARTFTAALLAATILLTACNPSTPDRDPREQLRITEMDQAASALIHDLEALGYTIDLENGYVRAAVNLGEPAQFSDTFQYQISIRLIPPPDRAAHTLDDEAIIFPARGWVESGGAYERDGLTGRFGFAGDEGWAPLVLEGPEVKVDDKGAAERLDDELRDDPDFPLTALTDCINPNDC